MDYNKIYDLKNDFRQIQLIQKATLESEEYGLDVSKGLFGSTEWWKAIDENILEGVITKVYMGGHNDNPEFEMKTNENVSKWEILGEKKYYLVDKHIRLTYTKDKLKKSDKILGKYVNTVLKIEIEIGI